MRIGVNNIKVILQICTKLKPSLPETHYSRPSPLSVVLVCGPPSLKAQSIEGIISYHLHRFKQGIKSKLTAEGSCGSSRNCTQVIEYTKLDNSPFLPKAGLLEGRREQLLVGKRGLCSIRYKNMSRLAL